MKFSEFFNIGKSQAELDFVDIDLDTDIPLFIDPYIFSIKQDSWSERCHAEIISFFQAAIDCVRHGNDAQGRHLLDNLSEPNETHLGLSTGTPSGRGVSGKQALDLYEQLKASQAATSGLLSELSECDLFVDGIGSDKISDMATNIIRRELIQYSQEQCRLHGIQLQGTVASGRLWNPAAGRWEQSYVQLPVAHGAKILLVPKASVRWNITFDAYKYYNHFVLNFLQQEHVDSRSGLVEALQSGERRVTKKALREAYPITKEFLSRFSKEHPEVLEAYKRQLEIPRQLTDRDFDPDFDECAFARALIETLRRIPTGDGAATKFHHFSSGLLEFLFYPSLICPEIEHEIHEGRKRIDIRFVNQSDEGFFFRMLRHPPVGAQAVFVECKNYGKEIGNPELDQLSGRFSPLRGRFGFLICRAVRDRNRLHARCKDTALDGRGIIIALEDDDLIEMLALVEAGRRDELDGVLQRRYEQLAG
ncbi:MAG: hypothetical protein WBQ86_24900 [Candidatus Binatus sp.]